MSLPIDRTSKSTLDTNLVNGNTSDAPVIKNSNDVVYNTIDELNGKVDGLISAGALSPYPPGQYNRLINGGFLVNQRVVSGTVTLAAGAYGHDRWKAGAAGCTYTFATVNNVTTITITAGSLVQVIEGINLLSGNHTLSWAGTSQGKIGAGSYGASGIKSAVTGGTNLSIEFNVGTLSKVQFNAGDAALPFQPRIFAEELALCQRYYQRIENEQGFTRIGIGTAGTTTAVDVPVSFKMIMRVLPTLIVSLNGHFELSDGNVATAISSMSLSVGLSSTRLGTVSITPSVAVIANRPYHLEFNSGASLSKYIAFDAEI